MKKIAMLFNLNRHQYEYETEFDSELTIDSIYNVLSKKYEVKKIEADKEFKWIDELNQYLFPHKHYILLDKRYNLLKDFLLKIYYGTLRDLYCQGLNNYN